MTRPAAADFEPFAAYRTHLVRLQFDIRPFNPDFIILEAVISALDQAAEHFTGNPSFYALHRHTPSR